MMLALLRKEWRQSRLPVVGGVVLMLAFYAIALSTQLFNNHPGAQTFDAYLGVLGAGAAYGMMLVAFMASVFGGVAFAVERRDRTAEFVAMLPVSRVAIAVSKLLTSAACLAGMFAANLLVLSMCVAGSATEAGFDSHAWSDAVRFYGSLPPAAAMTFGVAWLVSSVLESPTISAITSLVVTGATAVLGATLFRSYWHGRWAPNDDAALRTGMMLLQIIGWGTGLICVAAGTLIYRRRVKP
jgi:ABC-type transport system involved in multi-copper enzyme maturation permease subunit